jgi:ABC-type histidine transport system ATPase subunit
MTKVAVGMQRTTTSSKGTHGKTRVEKKKRIKAVRSMIGFSHQHFPVL